MSLIKNYCNTKQIQCLVSVLDSDLPRKPENDEKIAFEENEVVRTLSDEGNEGRMFNCEKF